MDPGSRTDEVAPVVEGAEFATVEVRIQRNKRVLSCCLSIEKFAFLVHLASPALGNMGPL